MFFAVVLLRLSLLYIKLSIHHLHISSFPLVSFTHISYTESGKKDNAVSLFDWGKFYEINDKILMPFSVQVHHSFVDGLHIGVLAEKLQYYLDNFE